MVIRWLLVAAVVLFGKLATYITAPLTALFDRAWLPWWLRWQQTFDGDLNSYWTSGKSDWLRDRGLTYDSWWVRYLCRLLWLWRNPAYWLALSLGFNQTGRIEISDDDPDDDVWENIREHRNVWLTRKYANEYGDKGFLYRGRWFITKRLYFHAVLGYKATGGERNAMVAIRPPVPRLLPKD